MQEIEFDRKLKGYADEYFWYLVVPDNGAPFVKHAWSVVRSGASIPEEKGGTETFTLDEFRQSGNQARIDKMEAALSKITNAEGT